MSREIMQQALDALEYHTMQTRPISHTDKAIEALEAALAQGEQESVSHLWECLGRWSSYLAVNGTQANMAPPNWLLDAVKAATSQPRKEWVGLTINEVWDVYEEGNYDAVQFARAVESRLKELNT